MYLMNVLPSKLKTDACCFKLVSLYSVLFLIHCWLTSSPGMAGCSGQIAVSWFYIIWSSHSDFINTVFCHKYMTFFWSFVILFGDWMHFIYRFMSEMVCKFGTCYIRGMLNCWFLDLGTTKFASLAVLIISLGWSALLSHVQLAQGLNMCPRFAAMVGYNDIPCFLQVNAGIVPWDRLWIITYYFYSTRHYS